MFAPFKHKIKNSSLNWGWVDGGGSVSPPPPKKNGGIKKKLYLYRSQNLYHLCYNIIILPNIAVCTKNKNKTKKHTKCYLCKLSWDALAFKVGLKPQNQS